MPYGAAAELSSVRALQDPGSKQPEKSLGVKKERAQQKIIPCAGKRSPGLHLPSEGSSSAGST